MKPVKCVIGTAVGITASVIATGAGDVRAQPATSSKCVPKKQAVMMGTPAMEVMPHAYAPSMTRMPPSHLIAAFALMQRGQTLYIDTRGKIIGRMAPQMHQVIWSGNSPYSVRVTPKPPAMMAPHTTP